MSVIRNKKKLQLTLTSFSAIKRGKIESRNSKRHEVVKKKLAKNDNWCFTQLQFPSGFPLQCLTQSVTKIPVKL